MYAEVLVEYPSKKIDKTFTYIIPDNLKARIKVGMHVSIPFVNKIINGFVLKIIDNYDGDYELKTIVDIIDEEIVLNQELIGIANYLHEETLSPLILCYQAMLPSSLKIKDKKHNYEKYNKYLELNDDVNIQKYNGKRQRELLNDLIVYKRVLKSNYDSQVVRNLINKKVIKEVKESIYRINKDKDDAYKDYDLNNEQLNVFNKIKNEMDENHTYLIEGVTGSGKTLVYLNLVKEVINHGKKAICLVPEISLTMQVVNQFYSWFGNDVAIFHSALSEGEKYDEYMKIVRGKVSVVVGTRSAIFTPLENIGIIIIDECHSDTYKQDVSPKYNALDVASKRCVYHNCPLVLGSATPQLEVRARALKGVYTYLPIKKRVNNKELPRTFLVDMTKEIKKHNFIFSDTLKEKINDRLLKGEQVILLLNRRGFSTTITCSSCGYTYKCKNCDITLTYHKSTNNLRCHYCGYTKLKDEICPSCHEKALGYLGLGTEKVEDEIKKIFPSAKVIRMDQDSTTKKGSHDKIIDSFRNHEYDILLGTQMISKGLDFPLVTLVGVINADASLNIPDFRSNEMTYSLLTQVSGRAGRSNLEGEIILQTFNPDNEVLNYVINNDFNGFYNYEMNLRRLLKYPPYYYLVSLKIISSDYDKALNESKNIANYLMKYIDNTSIVLGPTTHNLFKYNNMYRFVIVIKYRFDDKLKRTLEEIEELYMFNNAVKVEIDFNPYHI